MGNPTWTSPSPVSTSPNGEILRARQGLTNTCLPQSLLSVLPNCGITCLSNFVSHDYQGASCANTSDLNYLCTQPNSSGLTIGEGGVQCVVSFCAIQDQADVTVYNICNGIAGAQPRTARTITVTRVPSATSTSISAPTSSVMNTLPATIGIPTSTEDVSTIVMATESPTWVTATPVPAPSTAGAQSTISSNTSTNANGSGSPEATSSAMVIPNQTTSRSRLTTPQIVGIAVGGAALVVVALGMLLLVFWMRRRRQNRRRSQRRSRLVEQTPPPNYQSPPKRTVPTFDSISSSLAMPNTNGRFYATTPLEEKKSFWRKSIQSDDIGVAVSPKMPVEYSPASASSEKSLSLLLPTAPAAALWPAPLDMKATRDRRRYTHRPDSAATEFDDDLEAEMQESERILIDNQPFVLEKTSSPTRQRAPPPNLKLPAVPESPRRNAANNRIPLTPTYDNGNFDMSLPPRDFSPPSGSQGALRLAEHKSKSASSLMYAHKTVSQKTFPPRLPLRVVRRQPVEPLTHPRNAPLPPQAFVKRPLTATRRNEVLSTNRQSSVSSIYTEIEEDTTPEETNKQLGPRADPSTSITISRDMQSVSVGQRSPIKDLVYPQIPRSSAMSKQAERPAQPRANLNLTLTSITDSTTKPTRDQLVRAEASFMQTDTTSSDGYLSDETANFPVPLSLRKLTANGVQLRNNRSGANRQPVPQTTASSLREVLSSDTRTVSVAIPQRSPSTKARLTPSKSGSGDLYLTVEI